MQKSDAELQIRWWTSQDTPQVLSLLGLESEKEFDSLRPEYADYLLAEENGKIKGIAVYGTKKPSMHPARVYRDKIIFERLSSHVEIYGLSASGDRTEQAVIANKLMEEVRKRSGKQAATCHVSRQPNALLDAETLDAAGFKTVRGITDPSAPTKGATGFVLYRGPSEMYEEIEAAESARRRKEQKEYQKALSGAVKGDRKCLFSLKTIKTVLGATVEDPDIRKEFLETLLKKEGFYSRD